MKLLLSLFVLMITVPGFALTRQEVERLLQKKNMSLTTLESRGSKVIMGEVTGHGRAIPLSQVQVILTQDQAILKQEIEAVIPGAQLLNKVETLRFSGQYVAKEEIQATIVR